MKPEVVVNAAAYTAVDAAEDDEAIALLVNGSGPQVLAEAVAEARSVLVHISTDYVFSGEATQPVRRGRRARSRCPPTAAPSWSGEVAVRSLLPERGLRRADGVAVRGARAELREHDAGPGGCPGPRSGSSTTSAGSPPGAGTSPRQIVALVEAGAPGGIYHGTSSGQTTWFGLTQEIYRLIGADPGRVRPTTTDEFPRPAPRPAFSVLGHDRWPAVGLAPMRPWDEALAEALPLLVAARKG